MFRDLKPWQKPNWAGMLLSLGMAGLFVAGRCVIG